VVEWRGEYGYDFAATDRWNQRLLVEVKKRNPNSKISISVVQQLLGAAHAYGDGPALLISTADFTESARRFAGAQGGRVQLWTIEELSRFSQGGQETTTVEGVIGIAH
jgi:HJR/Mrr/RecB family endonuclease